MRSDQKGDDRSRGDSAIGEKACVGERLETPVIERRRMQAPRGRRRGTQGFEYREFVRLAPARMVTGDQPHVGARPAAIGAERLAFACARGQVVATGVGGGAFDRNVSIGSGYWTIL